MDSSQSQTRLLESESPASGNGDFSENVTDKHEAESHRIALESIKDRFEEFVALLDRIQSMKGKHKNMGISDETLMRENSDVRVIKTKSPWIPSFVWEDFCVPTVQNTISAERSICGRPRNETISSE